MDIPKDFVQVTNRDRRAYQLAPAISISYRGFDSKSDPRVVCSLNSTVLAALGWDEQRACRVDFSPSTRILRLEAAAELEPGLYTLTRKSKGLRRIAFVLPHISRTMEKQPATPYPCEVVDGVAYVEMPEWAGHPDFRPKRVSLMERVPDPAHQRRQIR